MKKLIASALLILLIVTLVGCHGIGEKAESLCVIYGATVILSLLLLIACCALSGKKKLWLITLFSSVLIINIGYTLLSVSTSLEMALNANRIAYLGSVFLMPAMLMIILNVTNTSYKRWLPISLLTVSAVVFLIAASPGILDIYYKEVSFEVVNGVATLVKVYGPLHPLYLFYLLGYFIAMVTVIIRSRVKKTIETPWHAVMLATAVFVNIGVWLIEQLSSIDFEFLSVSYIISELFLLGAHLVMNENQRLRELVEQKENALRSSEALLGEKSDVSPEAIECFMRGLDTLTPAERTVYQAHIDGLSTKQILQNLSITENTLKYHNKNIYGKLGVSSKKQLLQIHHATNAKNQAAR